MFILQMSMLENINTNLNFLASSKQRSKDDVIMNMIS